MEKAYAECGKEYYLGYGVSDVSKKVVAAQIIREELAISARDEFESFFSSVLEVDDE